MLQFVWEESDWKDNSVRFLEANRGQVDDGGASLVISFCENKEGSFNFWKGQITRKLPKIKFLKNSTAGSVSLMHRAAECQNG